MSDGETGPLAVRMRPRTLDEVVGQDHLTFPGSPLQLLVSGSAAVSVLLYGPPGTGKTTIASVIASSTSSEFVQLSATSATVRDLRRALSDADRLLTRDSRRTVLFVDEIHRFSRSQQDVLLPAVETGTVSLVGATTENPSFSVIPALASRSVLMVLRQLGEEDIAALLRRATDDPRGLGGSVAVDDDAVGLIARLASGDARQALGRLEVAAQIARATGSEHPRITTETVHRVAGTALVRYDDGGDQHYDITSAFIKSMRGSDPDAALYWLARMIEGGEDPRFIARRIIVHASEDVGMADPSVLGTAVAAAQAVQLVGLPEARISLAQATVAVATAPKSNAVIAGIDAALSAVRGGATHPVPKYLRDAHYPGADQLGHGQGYLYAHDYPHGVAPQHYLPPELAGTGFYAPTTNGFEAVVSRRLEAISRLRSTDSPGDTPDLT